MKFRREFGPQFEVPPDLVNFLLANGWRDDSWHNDVCPKFVKNGSCVDAEQILWCNAQDPADREIGRDEPRFSRAVHGPFGWIGTLWCEDDVSEVIRRLKDEGVRGN